MDKLYESSQIALEYIKYRPSYQQNLPQRIMKYLDHQEGTGKLDLMVDVGCGSGQSSNIFQPYFKTIIGIDTSQEQLKHAFLQNRFDNIRFVQGNAENLPVDDGSVDLLASGIAAHWFDLPKFFDEAKRVLTKRGCLAIFGYSRPLISLLSDTESNSWETPTKIFDEYLLQAFKANVEYMAKDIEVSKRYAKVFNAIPFAIKERVDDLHLIESISVNEVCGYFRSIHFYEIYMNKKIKELKHANGELTQEAIDSADPASQLKNELIKFWKLEDVGPDAKVVKADYELFLLLTRPS